MSLRYLLLPKLVATRAADPLADVLAGLGVAQDDIVVGAVAQALQSPRCARRPPAGHGHAGQAYEDVRAGRR
jgi:hypothetical protein